MFCVLILICSCFAVKSYGDVTFKHSCFINPVPFAECSNLFSNRTLPSGQRSYVTCFYEYQTQFRLTDDVNRVQLNIIATNIYSLSRRNTDVQFPIKHRTQCNNYRCKFCKQCFGLEYNILLPLLHIGNHAVCHFVLRVRFHSTHAVPVAPA